MGSTQYLAIPNIIHILDEFHFLEKSHKAYTASPNRFLHFCDDIGVPMAPGKNRGTQNRLVEIKV